MTMTMRAAEVLTRYKAEDLPEFVEVSLNDVNRVGNFGNRPLHVACVRGDSSEIRALISAGADINAAGELGNTPLHEAVGQDRGEGVEFLLRAGASPQAKNELKQTALDIAELMAREEVVTLLRAAE